MHQEQVPYRTEDQAFLLGKASEEVSIYAEFADNGVGGGGANSGTATRIIFFIFISLGLGGGGGLDSDKATSMNLSIFVSSTQLQ